MADIGYIALVLAFVAAIYSAVAFLSGARRRDPRLIASARNSLVAVCGLVSISVVVLTYALATHDFQIKYVAAHTSRDLSLPYRIAALWSGNDGSLLFWAWILSICAVVVVMQKWAIAKELVPYASSIIMLTMVFFLSLLISIANPFRELPFTPADGMGLNPMLLDPWMFIHPPFHLAGYIVFTVPFAFAIAALLTKRLGDEWIIATRRWTLVAWLFLGIGLFTGGWWAYVVLGWGGYWAWDPVENAGLMPWLVATAYLHSVMMQRRRNILKVWNLALIILTFSLTIFGTFLVRSGIIPSVHAFAQAPLLGSAFLTFIGGVLFGSLGLLYYRYKELKSEGEIESLVSRESTFLLNNLLLVGATFAVFIGTIFPVIAEAVRGVRIVVGPPFFNQVVVPIFVAIIFLTGVCTLIGWRRASVKNLIRNFLWPLLAALILGIGLFVLGIKEWHALVAFSICGFVLFTIFSEWFRGTRARHQIKGDNYLKSFLGLIGANRPRYGGYIAHIAIILIAIGVVGSVFDVDKGATLMPGESMTIENYTLTYETKDMYETPSKLVVSTTLSVYNQGRFVGTVIPERHFYRNPEQPVSEVAVRSTLRHDLYVVLVSWDKNGATAFEVSINPLVSWIWIGGGVLVLGGLICLWPDRQKLPNRDKPRLRRK